MDLNDETPPWLTSRPGHSSQFLLCSHPEVVLEDLQALTCFIFCSLVSPYFVAQENLDLKTRNFLNLTFLHSSESFSHHIIICNPRCPSHHWSIFFISSKILGVRKGFKYLLLKRKDMRTWFLSGDQHCSYYQENVFQKQSFCKVNYWSLHHLPVQWEGKSMQKPAKSSSKP